MIRMLDHTADVGFEVGGGSLEELFDEARRALLMIYFERPPESGSDRRRVELSAPDLEALLVRWLNELVHLVQDEGFVPVRAQIALPELPEERALDAKLTGAPLDLESYGWQGEVKSATFHGLCVRREAGGWRAQVILDV